MSDDDPLVQVPQHLRSAIVGSSLLLLDLHVGSTSILTGGAALVWTSAVGPPCRPAEIAQWITSDVGGSVRDHRGHVVRTVDLLLQQGLLVDARMVTTLPAAPEKANATRAARLKTIIAALTARSGPPQHLATGATTTELVSDDTEDAHFLGAPLASMTVAPGPSSEHQIAAVRSRRSDLPFRLVVDGRLRHRAANREELLRQVMFELNLLARLPGRDALALHAGAVELGGKVLLVAGESGSGKSTLTAALVQRGARYLTDEVAVVQLPTGDVAPFPKPIDLAPASWVLLGMDAPPRAGGDDPFEKAPLPVASIGSTSTGGTVVAMLELDRGASGPTPIDLPEQRATAVLRQAFREPFEQSGGDDLLQRVADWSTRTTMVRLGRTELSAAVDMALALLGQPLPEAG